ncbi:MAG: hypothetical protein K8I29_10395 [Alphaproteobacteria bacterium]|uniref:Uncharacterized protein n=1 Tax=Candidatus Nitrobium versatile TaxID=2884831 RepID=A0A953JBN4_9BACT|nr:hypothetical protein [Candidatus Nitrobium versatile]
MKRLMKKFEDIMVSITFAEAGEYEAARECMVWRGAEQEQSVLDSVYKPVNG